MVTLDRLRCTNCGADFDCYPPNASVLRCSREGCHALFVVRQARAFAQVQMDEDQAIGILRRLMQEALDQPRAVSLRERAIDIRKYIPDDFHACFCEALASKKSGFLKPYQAFLNHPHRETMTTEARDWAFDIALRNFEAYDEEAIKVFIHSNYPREEVLAKIVLLKIAIKKLTDQENKYAKVPRDIFICHSSSDQNIAMDVYHALTFDGNSCWIASENLHPDTVNYWDDITYAIQNAKLILVIGSEQCMLRPDPVKEMVVAAKASLARVEYKIDRVEHTAYFKYFFDGKQWVDGRHHGDDSLSLLKERVFRVLHSEVEPHEVVDPPKPPPAPPPVPPPAPPPVPPPAPHPRQPRIRVIVFFILVMLLTMIVGIPSVSLLDIYHSVVALFAAVPSVADTFQIPTPNPSTLFADVIPTLQATDAPTPLTSPIGTNGAAGADSLNKISVYTKAYNDMVEAPFRRSKPVSFEAPYAAWEQSGILTFRGDPFRRNAAYGTVNIVKQQLSEVWRVPMEGSIKTKSARLTGVGWPGQPLIVKWPVQLRDILALSDEAKNTRALKEVMVGGQNGKLYFLDLETGKPTRDPISEIWPFNGVLSLQTNASPMLAAGQHTGVLDNRTVDNGLYLYNLINGKALTMINGKDRFGRSNYSGVNSSPAFDKATGTMIFGGENGILYTMEPKDDFDTIFAVLKIDPAYQRYTWLADKQRPKSTNIDGAVAMYKQYAYFGDQSGIVQCVDVNTLTPVWAVNTGDNVDATIALDIEDEATVALYTANTILNQGRDGKCTIRRLNALTGLQVWAFTVPGLTYTTEAEVGVYASPVVGDGEAQGLVFFTATDGLRGATLYALRKRDGSLQWSLPLSTPTLSSPVAVYGDAGEAWVLQATDDGTLSLINAFTGQVAATLKLDGGVTCSPAVYNDMLVIATTGLNTSNIYGIRLE